CQTAEACTARAVIGIDAVFQDKFSFQAVAQIFNTFEADAAGGVQASLDTVAADALTSGIVTLIDVGKTRIDDTVDGHGRLCRSSTCERAQNCESQERFFH